MTDRFFAPPITPEQLYRQDKRRRDYDYYERKLDIHMDEYYERSGKPRPKGLKRSWLNTLSQPTSS